MLSQRWKQQLVDKLRELLACRDGDDHQLINDAVVLLLNEQRDTIETLIGRGQYDVDDVKTLYALEQVIIYNGGEPSP